MKFVLSAAVAAAALALAAAPASAAIVSVLGTTAPWNPLVAGNGAFAAIGATGPVAYAVNAGDSITIDYLDGLTGSFGLALPPIADAQGYVGGVFGSGDPGDTDGDPMTDNHLTGIGSASALPSFYIDPTNVGPPIWLNALLGGFVDSSGKVIGAAFATGNDAYNVVAPTGAVALLLGLNDDVFSDNNGALRVSVTGSSVISAAPEPATWGLMIAGFGLAGSVLRRRRAALA